MAQETCPKCGSHEVSGYNPPDFESKTCKACGKVYEGLSYAGLSGETDGGSPGPQGGSPFSSEDELDPARKHLGKILGVRWVNGKPVMLNQNNLRRSGEIANEDCMNNLTAFSSGPEITSSEALPTDKPYTPSWSRKKKVVKESEGWLEGHPTDLTSTGKITVKVLDNLYLQVQAPQRILEQVEAFKFFEQFQILLPRTPMLNIRVMESIATWWRNYATTGDVLEIDCTTGFSSVVNPKTGNYYALGCLGSAPDTF